MVFLKKGINLPYQRNILKYKSFRLWKEQKFFIKALKSKIKYEYFENLRNALKEVIKVINKSKSNNQTILFSPCAASFDSFKNFEDRGFILIN